MVKKQQMRWNRYTVQSFLDVRIQVLNGTLEGALRHWHKSIRPVADQPNRFCQHDTTHNFAHSPLGVALLPLDIFLDCAHGMVPHDVVYKLGKQ